MPQPAPTGLIRRVLTRFALYAAILQALSTLAIGAAFVALLLTRSSILNRCLALVVAAILLVIVLAIIADLRAARRPSARAPRSPAPAPRGRRISFLG